MEITWQFLAIVRNNQYWLYLVNELNMIVKFFDTSFECYGDMYTYVDNVLIYTSITLLCVFLCSLCVLEHESKVPPGSASAICDY